MQNTRFKKEKLKIIKKTIEHVIIAIVTMTAAFIGIKRLDEIRGPQEMETNDTIEINLELNPESDIDEKLLQAFDFLPDTVKTIFEENGWSAKVITNEEMTNLTGEDGWAGVTVYSQKTVYINDEDKDVWTTFFHEIGHVIDYENGYSDTEEFKKIKESEFEYYKKHHFEEMYDNPDYFKDNKEFFAELFALWMINKGYTNKIQDYYSKFA